MPRFGGGSLAGSSAWASGGEREKMRVGGEAGDLDGKWKGKRMTLDVGQKDVGGCWMESGKGKG